MAQWYLHVVFTSGDQEFIPVGNERTEADAWAKRINDEMADKRPDEPVLVETYSYPRRSLQSVTVVPFERAVAG